MTAMQICTIFELNGPSLNEWCRRRDDADADRHIADATEGLPVGAWNHHFASRAAYTLLTATMTQRVGVYSCRMPIDPVGPAFPFPAAAAR